MRIGNTFLVVEKGNEITPAATQGIENRIIQLIDKYAFIHSWFQDTPLIPVMIFVATMILPSSEKATGPLCNSRGISRNISGRWLRIE